MIIIIIMIIINDNDNDNNNMRKPQSRNGGDRGGAQKIINISLKWEKYMILKLFI